MIYEFKFIRLVTLPLICSYTLLALHQAVEGTLIHFISEQLSIPCSYFSNI